jgi:23S rRNA pseudouridine1911/1915/1917 synthase
MSEPDNELLSVDVPTQSAGQRLDAFLAGALTDYSRTTVRRAIDAGTITVNGHSAKPSYRLNGGEHVAGNIQKPVDDGPIPEDIPLDILFEDDAIVAVNKPPRMVVHPARGHWSGTLTSALAFHIRQLSSVGGANRPGIVHRLDRDTSGVILVAKNDTAHMRLAAQFESRQVKKEYLAVCRGHVDRDQDVVCQPIGIHPYQREKMAIRAGHSKSRDATTVYQTIRRYKGFCYVRLLPTTGRTHQLRVHMAHVGCPVVCDRLYAGHARVTTGDIRRCDDATIIMDRQALHAHRISFQHPISGTSLMIEAPLPADMHCLLEALQEFRSLG